MATGQDLKSLSHNRMGESPTTSATSDLHQVGTAVTPQAPPWETAALDSSWLSLE